MGDGPQTPETGLRRPLQLSLFQKARVSGPGLAFPLCWVYTFVTFILC